MKSSYYKFLVKNFKTEHHIRHLQEPDQSGNSDSKVF